MIALFLQHPYVYGVLIFEAMATFIGQVSVLSLIAIFGAATTAMVHSPPSHAYHCCIMSNYAKGGILKSDTKIYHNFLMSIVCEHIKLLEFKEFEFDHMK